MLSNKKKELKEDLFFTLQEIERKVAWLSNFIIHNANYEVVKEDDLKVGGHQASCASVVSILVILYFKILNKHDRVAIKPHASPVFHAIQYLLGNQKLENLKKFRKFGGAQAYPSMTKDYCDVDFSTGSVGLGGSMTLFSALTQDFLIDNDFIKHQNIRKMISIFGDAELDEGNVYEALLEGAKHNIRNCWWIIDYNRQSLDGIIQENLFEKIIKLFELMDWNVVILKYGKKLEELKKHEGGQEILNWIDDCPNELFSALTFQGGSEWRKTLKSKFHKNQNVLKILDGLNNDDLHQLMTNLAGHDLYSLNEAFSENLTNSKPTCFICYTVKGFGLPLAGHKDNHSGIMNKKQFSEYKERMKIEDGNEWEKHEGLKIHIKQFDSFLTNNPFYKQSTKLLDQKIIISKPKRINFKIKTSTQEAFGNLLHEIGKGKESYANRIVTTSPDVTVSTNLGSWVNQRNIFRHQIKDDLFTKKNVFSAQKWKYSQNGQHIELGIAENNLFLLLATLGISDKLFGVRLLPVGTIYDTFISRGLDALNYATYIDARFILVGTPSGVTLSHEGGAHQSVITPNIGISQPNLLYFEPSYADELTLLLMWALEFIQEKEGSSIYFRLSTKKISQPKRVLSEELKSDILSGAYWLEQMPNTDIVIICSGIIVEEVLKCKENLINDSISLSILLAISPDKLYRDWENSKKVSSEKSHIEKKLDNITKDVPIITIIDGHSSSLSWIGSVKGHKIFPLGVNKFGQSGDLKEIYEYTNIDFKSIIDSIARILVK